MSVTAAADYTAAQIEAWSQPNTRDLGEWNVSMLSRMSFVAEVDGHVVGFSDVDREGYIHMMFVAPNYQRHGIAGVLLKHAEQRARAGGATALSANVSITARPFFERHGFVVEAERHAEVRGVTMLNFSMRKVLSSGQPTAGAPMGGPIGHEFPSDGR